MSDSESTTHRRVSRRTLLLRILLALFCAGLLALLSLTLYLNSSYGVAHVSNLLTAYLHQPFRVAAIRTSGDAITLRGIALGNPTNMAAGNIVEVDSLTVAPFWGDLLRGRQRFRLLAITGMRLDLRKDSAGTWNFTELQRRFSSQKPSGAELFISRFSISDSAVQINGQGVKDIALQLANLSTMGSGDARVNLAFEDVARSRYTLTGTVRPGSNPSFDLALSAPSLSYTALYGMIGRKPPALAEGISGGMALSATLRDNRIAVAVTLDFRQPAQPTAPRHPPLNGTLKVAAGYDIARDEAWLDDMTITVNRMVTARATGSAEMLKTERRFRADIQLNRIDLAPLAGLVPQRERHHLTIGGNIADTAIHLAGSGAQGLTRLTGSLRLRDGSLERAGVLVFKGLGAAVAFSRERDAFRVDGALTVQNSPAQALLETLDAPFGITLSSRMKVIRAELPALSAGARGIRGKGRLAYVPDSRDPITGALRIRVPSAPLLQPLLGQRDLNLISGSGTMNINLTGRNPGELAAVVESRISSLQLIQGKRNFGMKSGAIDTRFTRSNGKDCVTGKASFSGITLDGTSGTVGFSYRYEDRTATLENGTMDFNGAAVAFDRITGRVSPATSSPAGTRLLVAVDMNGGQGRRGDIAMKGASASVRGTLATGTTGSWFEGTADIAAGLVSWQGKPVASPMASAVISRSEVRTTVSGAVLGGTLAGNAVVRPFAAAKGADYRLGITGMRLAQAGGLVPATRGVTLSDGTLDATLSGTITEPAGIAGRFDLTAAGISATGSGSKTLVNNAGFILAGTVAGTAVDNRITLDKALFRVGDSVAVRLAGEVDHPLTAKREGRLVYSLQRTPLTAIIDSFVNILPRIIQEATTEGTIAAEGAVTLRNGRQQLNGAVQFADVLVDVPSQKLKASGISGSVPYSLDMPGTPRSTPPDAVSFSRENYPALLKQMGAPSQSGHLLRIGGVSFGTINLNDIQMRTSAGDGVTRIDSLRSSLYEGGIYGAGQITTTKNSIAYRGDLLINGLSLNRFCSTIPSIKDYISGRLDGIISLENSGAGLKDLTGFTELWVREGDGEKMLVSKTFLQKLSGKKLSGFFFSSDRPFDQAEIAALVHGGYLTFDKLDISHTNIFGVRDLSVSVAQAQNRIAIDHLFDAVKQAAVRGKAAAGETAPDGTAPAQAPLETEFKWQE